MEISKGAEAIDLALWFPKSRTLAITDFQLGYEEYMNNHGVMVPRINFEEIVKHLKQIFSEKKKIQRIIINGDLKHEFGTISEQEWSEAIKLLAFISANCTELILIKGNHDTIIKPIADMKKIGVRDHYLLKEEKTLFIHGHKEPDEESLKGIARIVIGHEHPAVMISDGVKHEKYKCFLKGKYGGKELIVLPAFNFVSLGSDVTREQSLSPLIKNIGSFSVYAVEDKVYEMGKVNNLL